MNRWNRGSRDHHLYHRQDAELNLIPLIDILSVMVAFLLVYSADVEVVQNSKGVEIPQSTAEVLPKQSVVVMITREQLFVQGELVASIAEIMPRTYSTEPTSARGPVPWPLSCTMASTSLMILAFGSAPCCSARPL